MPTLISVEVMSCIPRSNVRPWMEAVRVKARGTVPLLLQPTTLFPHWSHNTGRQSPVWCLACVATCVILSNTSSFVKKLEVFFKIM